MGSVLACWGEGSDLNTVNNFPSGAEAYIYVRIFPYLFKTTAKRKEIKLLVQHRQIGTNFLFVIEQACKVPLDPFDSSFDFLQHSIEGACKLDPPYEQGLLFYQKYVWGTPTLASKVSNSEMSYRINNWQSIFWKTWCINLDNEVGPQPFLIGFSGQIPYREFPRFKLSWIVTGQQVLLSNCSWVHGRLTSGAHVTHLQVYL